MSKLILPEDVDTKTAIDMLQSFIDALNYSVLRENIIMPRGTVLIKGDSIHELLASCIKQQKQLRMDRAYNEAKNLRKPKTDVEIVNRKCDYKYRGK